MFQFLGLLSDFLRHCEVSEKERCNDNRAKVPNDDTMLRHLSDVNVYLNEP